MDHSGRGQSALANDCRRVHEVEHAAESLRQPPHPAACDSIQAGSNDCRCRVSPFDAGGYDVSDGGNDRG